MASNNIHRSARGGHALYPLPRLATTEPGPDIGDPRLTTNPPHLAPMRPRSAPVVPRAPPKQIHATLKSRYDGICSNWWLWEILAVVLSLGTFSALVTVLLVYDGRAVPQLPRGVSLNAIVSILGTMSKTSLMFSVTATLGQFKWLLFSGRTRQLKDLQLYDEASRGPLGSSALLLSEKGCSWASIGALITVLVLALDPFFQQLIRVSSRVVYHDSPLLILRRALDLSGLGPMTQEVFKDSLVEAINDAIYTPGPILDTQPLCPTGNCLWPRFTSLGFCSSCQDITQPMQQDSTFVSTSLYYPSGFQGEKQWGEKNVTFTYSVPRSLLDDYFTDADSRNPKAANLTIATFTVSVNDSRETGLSGVPRFLAWAISSNGAADTNRTPTGFGLYTFIRTSTLFSSPGTVLSAHLCSMSLCLQDRNVSMSSGKVGSSVVDTIYADRDLTTHSGDTRSYIFPHGTNSLTLTLGPATEPALETALDTLLTGNVTETTTSQPQDSNSTSSSTLIAGLDASHDIPLAMANLAAAMTNSIRDLSNHSVSGQLGITETYVRVSWPWIILPAMLVVLGALFLVTGIVATDRRGVDVWKESEFALLFHGLEGGSGRFAGVEKMSEMDQAASRMKARMARTRAGGRVLRLTDQQGRIL